MNAFMQRTLSIRGRRPFRESIAEELRRVLPEIDRALMNVQGDLLDPHVQCDIDERLAGFTEWGDWIGTARRPLRIAPWSVGPDLPVTPAFLVGLSRALFPRFEIAPYDIGPVAVTEVLARPGASALSHSQNDLVAPPHTAGFFDVHPPLIAVFACVRPHPGGGAETTITDLERTLEDLSPAHRCELMERDHHYVTPRRLGRQQHPFRVLTETENLPFVRFRMEYTADRSPGLGALHALALDEDHRFVAPLAAGEVLFVWNGAPHGRLPQCGATPRQSTARRELLRCRLRLRADQTNSLRA